MNITNLAGVAVLVVIAAAALVVMDHDPVAHEPDSTASAVTRPPAAPPPPARPSPSTAAPRRSVALPAESDPPDGEAANEDLVNPDAAAVPSSKAQAAAFAARLRVAEAAARAFARPVPSVSRDRWWKHLSGYLAARALEDFRYVDPRRVPFTKVTGSAEVVPTPAPATLLTMVRVPTDAGDYAVEIETADHRPQVSAIHPWHESP